MAVRIVVALAVLLAGLGFLLLAMTVVRRRAIERRRASDRPGRKVIRSRQPSEPGPPPPAVARTRAGLARGPGQPPASSSTARGCSRCPSSASPSAARPSRCSGRTRSRGSAARSTPASIADILKTIESDGRYYNPVGRFYIVDYPHTDDADNMYVKAGVAKDGIMTLYQKCAHLGCRVPYCPTSEWFECPCHGSKYNNAGERQPGSPAPAGLWRFPFEISATARSSSTRRSALAQPPLGTDTIHQPPAGAHCIAAAEGAE